jgi:plasmid stabilization system protein ParE
MKHVTIDPRAEADILQASLYYEIEKKDLGFAFAEEVEEAIQQIRNWPAMFSFIEAPYRGCYLEKFPYTIIYRDEESYLFIVSVVHQRRHPDYWKERLKETRG